MIARVSSSLLLASLIAAASSAAYAQRTQSFEDDTVADFSSGDITTSTLTWDGRLRAAYARQHFAGTEASVVWGVAEADGARWIATGHDGKLFKQEAGKKEATLVHDFEEPSLYALAARGKDVFVGASPSGVVYRLSSGSKPKELSKTGAETIWQILPREKDLVVATGGGEPALLLSVDDQGTTATLAEVPTVKNILAVATVPGSEDLVIGTQGPGYVARVTAGGPKGKNVRVLLDPELEEVRRVVVQEDGTILAAVNGVRSPGEKLLGKGSDPRAMSNKPRQEGFIARIAPDGAISEFWTAPEAPIHDFHLRKDGTLIVAAGTRGNLYETTTAGETNRIGVATEEFLTTFAPLANGNVLVGTGAEAGVFELTIGSLKPGIYESRVFDAKGSAKWGRIRAHVDASAGAVRVATRSGNTAKPGDLWSPWTDAKDFSSGDQVIGSPIGRFIQYRLELDPAADGASGPSVDVVDLYYTQQNSAPEVKSVNVGKGNGGGGGAPGGQGGPKEPGQEGGGMPPQARAMRPEGGPQPPGSGSLNITWQAEDPNGDPLKADLYLRQRGAKEWIEVETDLAAPRYALDTKRLSDGRYQARVVVHDKDGNAVGTELKGEMTSDFFLVDNTAADYIPLNAGRQPDGTYLIRFRAEDSTSLVTDARWRHGLEDFRILPPEDGLFDQLAETFTLRLGSDVAKPGTVITFAFEDEAKNLTVRQVTLD